MTTKRDKRYIHRNYTWYNSFGAYLEFTFYIISNAIKISFTSRP